MDNKKGQYSYVYGSVHIFLKDVQEELRLLKAKRYDIKYVEIATDNIISHILSLTNLIDKNLELDLILIQEEINKMFELDPESTGIIIILDKVKVPEGKERRCYLNYKKFKNDGK